MFQSSCFKRRITMLEEAKQAVQDAANTLTEYVPTRKMDLKFDARMKAIEKNLLRVDNRIEALGKRFPRTQGPRFPFGLLLLAGLGYALYTPSTRRKLLELVGNVSPAARDTIEGAIGRTGDAVDEVKGGSDPLASVKDAAQDIGQRAQDKAHDMKRDVERTGNHLADQAQDATHEAQRGADRLADKAQDKINDLKH
jgi:hypothetical protein